MTFPDHRRYFSRAGKVLSEANRLRDLKRKTEQEIEYRLNMLGIGFGVLLFDLTMLLMREFLIALILGIVALWIFARRWY